MKNQYEFILIHHQLYSYVILILISHDRQFYLVPSLAKKKHIDTTK